MVINEPKNIEHDHEMPEERYISPQKMQNIIDDLKII